MTLLVRPEARADILAAMLWYEKHEEKLGGDFITEMDAVFDRIAKGPKHYRITYRGFRRALVRRLPYAVYFLDEGEKIIIFAVLHQNRQQDALDERIDRQQKT